MAIDTIKVSVERANALMKRRETHFADMKAREIAPAKPSRTLSAFVNADGGEVFIGLSGPKEGPFSWAGFDREEDANGLIQLVQNLFPIGDVARCVFLSCDAQKGLVLHIEIPKTPEMRPASDGIHYLRRSAQNLPQQTQDQIERLKLNKGITSAEDRRLNIDKEEITKSTACIDFLKNIIPSAEPESWLMKQKLIVDSRPTVAGFLLFSDEPQVELPKSSIKLYRYKTNDQNGSRATLDFDPISIEGHLYLQIYTAATKIKSVAEKIPFLGQEGLTKIDYPTDAIHEIVTNAVIHRDYSLQDDVHVRIFDNRIEVESPGRLPAHITPDNILEERFARNGKIVRILNKFPNPPNKDVGEGLNTAFQAMRNLKLRDPVIIQKQNSVTVVLKHEKLGTPEQIIVDYLKNNDEINNSVARSLCFIGSENSMKRIFQKMMTSGLIERIPGRPKRKTGYRKGPNFTA
jgi:ATP-dependent DNA helicase RecG